MATEKRPGCLLLAAGFGTRLRPLTDFLPKCLVPIRGRPLLEYWLNTLALAGSEPIVINTHYRADLVERYIAASPWKNNVILSAERELLGTGGALLANASRFPDGPLLVAHADNLSAFDLRAFFDAHEKRPPEAALTMMTFTTDVPETCGIVTTDERGLVNAFHEKVASPPGNRANGAVYIIDSEVVAYARSLRKRVVDISTEILPHFIGRMATWHNAVYHRDIGDLDAWRTAQLEYPDPIPVPPEQDPWAHVLDALTPATRAEIDRLLAGGT